MAISLAWPVSGERRADWERMVQYHGLCEVLPDRTKPGAVERTFRDWAQKRRLAYVEGENMVAFDPKAFNPKDSLDRAKFGFLLRYIRSRDYAVFKRDVETAFNLRSMYVLDALKNYWVTEGVITEQGSQISANRDLLRLIGFSYIDLIQALDGVVKKEYLAEVVNGHAMVGPSFGEELGAYVCNFDLIKERFFDAEFLLHAAGQPVPLRTIGHQMGVDDIEDVKMILREAKKRFDLNVEISNDHVMFGPPSQKAIEGLITREKNTKGRLEQTETQLRERLKTIKDLLDRYNSREAKILNEAEHLKDEGKMVWAKAKIVRSVMDQIANKRG